MQKIVVFFFSVGFNFQDFQLNVKDTFFTSPVGTY